MVSTTDNNNEIVVKKPTPDLPEGRYSLVGWDIDTTGKRLIDEICQVAAFTPNSQFSQYIMPYGDLNIFAQRRYGLRVITVTRYRLLKNLKTNKFLKTKSEVSAMVDFLDWLEQVKGDTDGVVLIYHETRKIAPAMLMEAFQRYNLYDRFTAVVKGFCNIFTLAEAKCAQTMKSFSLKVLSRVLLDKPENLRSASDRAKTNYNIVQHLGLSERQDLETDNKQDPAITQKYTEELVRQYTQTIATEEKDIAVLKDFLFRQNTFRPVFKDLMSFDAISRQNASRLRRCLVENDLDFDQLKNAWDNGGKKSIEELLQKISISNEKDFAELLEILDCYFDPEKKPVTAKYTRRRRFSSRSQKGGGRYSYSSNNGNANGGGRKKSQSVSANGANTTLDTSSATNDTSISQNDTTSSIEAYQTCADDTTTKTDALPTSPSSAPPPAAPLPPAATVPSPTSVVAQ